MWGEETAVGDCPAVGEETAGSEDTAGGEDTVGGEDTAVGEDTAGAGSGDTAGVATRLVRKARILQAAAGRSSLEASTQSAGSREARIQKAGIHPEIFLFRFYFYNDIVSIPSLINYLYVLYIP